MKKTLFTIYAILLIVTALSVTISAINTPWIPLNPDSETTAQDKSEEGGETVQGELEEDGEKGDPVEGSSDDSTPDENAQTAAEGNDTLQDSEDSFGSEANSDNAGCRSTVVAYAAFACCLAASVCVIKTGKENE